MLDVMRRPPIVLALLAWRASRVELPDSDTTVIGVMPEDQSEPVWPCYYDDALGEWFGSDGMPLGGAVTWWASFPEQIFEPKSANEPDSLLQVLRDASECVRTAARVAHGPMRDRCTAVADSLDKFLADAAEA